MPNAPLVARNWYFLMADVGVLFVSTHPLQLVLGKKLAPLVRM